MAIHIKSTTVWVGTIPGSGGMGTALAAWGIFKPGRAFYDSGGNFGTSFQVALWNGYGTNVPINGWFVELLSGPTYTGNSAPYGQGTLYEYAAILRITGPDYYVYTDYGDKIPDNFFDLAWGVNGTGVQDLRISLYPQPYLVPQTTYEVEINDLEINVSMVATSLYGGTIDFQAWTVQEALPVGNNWTMGPHISVPNPDPSGWTARGAQAVIEVPDYGEYWVKLIAIDSYGYSYYNVEHFEIAPSSVFSSLTDPSGALFLAIKSPSEANAVQVYMTRGPIAQKEARALISGAKYPSIAKDVHQHLYLMVLQGTQWKLKRSTDDGRTFTEGDLVAPLDTTYKYASFAILPGNIWAVIGVKTTKQVHFFYSTNAGASWSAPKLVATLDKAEPVNLEPLAAAGSSDLLAVRGNGSQMWRAVQLSGDWIVA